MKAIESVYRSERRNKIKFKKKKHTDWKSIKISVTGNDFCLNDMLNKKNVSTTTISCEKVYNDVICYGKIR